MDELPAALLPAFCFAQEGVEVVAEALLAFCFVQEGVEGPEAEVQEPALLLAQDASSSPRALAAT